MVSRSTMRIATVVVGLLNCVHSTSDFHFQASQVIDGKTVACATFPSGVFPSGTGYTECGTLTVEGRKGFQNGIECGGIWKSQNPSGSDLIGLCTQLTGSSSEHSFYFECENTATRSAWTAGVWSTADDNGFVATIRCANCVDTHVPESTITVAEGMGLNGAPVEGHLSFHEGASQSTGGEVIFSSPIHLKSFEVNGIYDANHEPNNGGCSMINFKAYNEADSELWSWAEL